MMGLGRQAATEGVAESGAHQQQGLQKRLATSASLPSSTAALARLWAGSDAALQHHLGRQQHQQQQQQRQQQHHYQAVEAPLLGAMAAAGNGGSPRGDEMSSAAATAIALQLLDQLGEGATAHWFDTMSLGTPSLPAAGILDSAAASAGAGGRGSSLWDHRPRLQYQVGTNPAVMSAVPPLNLGDSVGDMVGAQQQPHLSRDTGSSDFSFSVSGTVHRGVPVPQDDQMRSATAPPSSCCPLPDPSVALPGRVLGGGGGRGYQPSSRGSQGFVAKAAESAGALFRNGSNAGSMGGLIRNGSDMSAWASGADTGDDDQHGGGFTRRMLPMPGGGAAGSRRQRENLPKIAVAQLKIWLYEHYAHPYPTEEEKELLAMVR